jgi:choline dehydrogenase-like flavoprotein
LSEGVFESPKLLMLSGIGPAAELSKHGIPLIVDSPHVGQNLIDHPGVPVVLEVKEGYGMEEYLIRSSAKKEASVSAYRKDHSGPLGSGLLELVGFPRIDKYLEQDEQYRQAKAANGGRDFLS